MPGWLWGGRVSVVRALAAKALGPIHAKLELSCTTMYMYRIFSLLGVFRL